VERPPQKKNKTGRIFWEEILFDIFQHFIQKRKGFFSPLTSLTCCIYVEFFFRCTIQIVQMGLVFLMLHFKISSILGLPFAPLNGVFVGALREHRVHQEDI